MKVETKLSNRLCVAVSVLGLLVVYVWGFDSTLNTDIAFRLYGLFFCFVVLAAIVVGIALGLINRYTPFEV